MAYTGSLNRHLNAVIISPLFNIVSNNTQINVKIFLFKCRIKFMLYNFLAVTNHFVTAVSFIPHYMTVMVWTMTARYQLIILKQPTHNIKSELALPNIISTAASSWFQNSCLLARQ